jgi:hypothetical protein
VSGNPGVAQCDPDFKLCTEIANRQKHFRQKDGDLVVGASIEQGFGVGRYGAGTYGIGEQSVTIELVNGTEECALTFVRRIGEKLRPLYLDATSSL